MLCRPLLLDLSAGKQTLLLSLSSGKPTLLKVPLADIAGTELLQGDTVTGTGGKAMNHGMAVGAEGHKVGLGVHLVLTISLRQRKAMVNLDEATSHLTVSFLKVEATALAHHMTLVQRSVIGNALFTCLTVALPARTMLILQDGSLDKAPCRWLFVSRWLSRHVLRLFILQLTVYRRLHKPSVERQRGDISDIVDTRVLAFQYRVEDDALNIVFQHRLVTDIIECGKVLVDVSTDEVGQQVLSRVQQCLRTVSICHMPGNVGFKGGFKTHTIHLLGFLSAVY